MSRQAVLAGFPSPVFANETGRRQAITAASVFLDETSPAPPPPSAGVSTFRSPIKNLGGMMNGHL